MTMILIDGEDFGNRGFMAIVMGLTRCLRAHIPDVEVVVFSSDPEKYESVAKPYLRIHRSPWAWPRNKRDLKSMVRLLISFSLHFLLCLAIRIGGRVNSKMKTPYYNYGLVIHYIADWPNEIDRSAWKTIPSFVWLLAICTLCDRPVCILPSSMGPFKTNLTKVIVKFVLNKTSIVALREAVSYRYVKSLGLTKPQVILSSDMAFLLDPASQEKADSILRTEGLIKSDKPLVGICPNQRDGRVLGLDPTTGQPKYIEFLAHITDYIIEKLDATVCLIPHVYDYDDIKTCQQIIELSKYKATVKLLSREYSTDEIKGVIGRCDMFIGNWMHSTIAATSMAVPTLAIAFSDKFYRLMGETMGQKYFILDLRKQTYSELLISMKAKINDLWINREAVKRELETRAKAAKEQAWSYGRLISERLVSCHDKGVDED